MRNILLLFILFQSFTGNLFSQNPHYSLGGHLFAGEYPINNPVSTGDTGIVILYQMKNSVMIPVDTTQFSNLGYFVFLDVPEGEYFLKAGLTKKSAHYISYFPTYYSSNLTWNSSNSVKLTDGSIYEANIRLLPTNRSLSGTASVKGVVVQSYDEDAYRKLQGTEVLLFNEKLEPLTFCITDNNGAFSFSDLPFGTYYLSVELTGMFSTAQKITLDQGNPGIDNLVMEVMSYHPANIEESQLLPGVSISNAFPNPAEDHIKMIVRTTEPENFEIGIYSLTGIKILSFSHHFFGIRSLEIPLGSLSKGTYILRIHASGNHLTKVQKFVKL
jgi:hypothetical protein